MSQSGVVSGDAERGGGAPLTAASVGRRDDQNRVCSVLFIDIVGYSRRTVAEQMQLKRVCNEIVADAVDRLAPAERVILDTGDGVSITFLGAPENALFVALRARDEAHRLSMRIGVNLGPVRLVNDINGQENVVGDGINVAQRVMSFCEPDELLVSRSFYEVACRLATDYVNLFIPRGVHLDKHTRQHEVYGLVPDARLCLKNAEAEWLERNSAPARASDRSRAAKPAPAEQRPPRAEEPAKVVDAGTHLIISARTQDGVDQALSALGPVKLISPATRVGDYWVSTCEHPVVAVSECHVERLGHMQIVTGPSCEAVAAKVDELMQFGAVLVGEIELVAGKWTAVCEQGDSAA